MNWAIGLDVAGRRSPGHWSIAPAKPPVLEQPNGNRASRGVARVKEAARLLDFAKAQKRPVAGVGVAVPGAVEIATGVVLRAQISDWENVPLKQTLEAAGHPGRSRVGHAGGGLGGHVVESGPRCPRFRHVTIGTGIGAGIVINGQLHHGHTFAAARSGTASWSRTVRVRLRARGVRGPGCRRGDCRAGRATGRQNARGFDNGRPPRRQPPNRP